MTVYEASDCEEGAEPVLCHKCGRPLEKWINIVEIGDLCPVCAHYLMRILFQDIIEYHNGKGVSLLNIFYHGHFEGDYYNPGPAGKLYDPEKNEEWIKAGEPDRHMIKDKSEKDKNLFDF